MSIQHLWEICNLDVVLYLWCWIYWIPKCHVINIWFTAWNHHLKSNINAVPILSSNHNIMPFVTHWAPFLISEVYRGVDWSRRQLRKVLKTPCRNRNKFFEGKCPVVLRANAFWGQMYFEVKYILRANLFWKLACFGRFLLWALRPEWVVEVRVCVQTLYLNDEWVTEANDI